MTATWLPEELERLSRVQELQIAARRADGSLRRRVTIWAVTAGRQVYVRTWYRRDSGWFAHVLDSRRARIRVPGLERDVRIEGVGAGTAPLPASVDEAYRQKYALIGRGAVDRMVTTDAAAATLQLLPEQGRTTSGEQESGTNHLITTPARRGAAGEGSGPVRSAGVTASHPSPEFRIQSRRWCGSQDPASTPSG